MGFRFLTVMLTIIAVTDVLEAGWLRRTVRKIGRGIKRGVRKIGRAFKKHGRRILCKAGWLYVCPAVVGAAGAAIAAGTSGAGAAAAAVGTAAGVGGCKLAGKRCKRDAQFDPEHYIYVPFSPYFSDYDLNEDKLIEYEEFVYAIMNSIPLENPEDTRQPFEFADANDDGVLETDEFIAAPFIWADDMFEDWSNMTVIASVA